VDKNLKYHGLIQAYSRTNRLYNSDKPHGNIVSFRNLKKATDTALALFGDENAKEVVFKKPFEEQRKVFEIKLNELRSIAPTIDYVDSLQGEEEKATFVKTFRDLLRVKSSLETFAEFSFDSIGISEQEFYDYQSKYLDIHDSIKNGDSQKESILDQIDFELELTIRDIINFDYIILLIAGLKNITNDTIREKKTEDILKIFDRDVQLRKKKELIKKFIEESLPQIAKADDVEQAFNKFWAGERADSLKKLAKDENIPEENIEKLIGEYLYSQKLPREQDIADMLPQQPKIKERSTILSRIKLAIESIVEKFEW
jgi:type I restriction enzyme R subunit